MTLHNFGSIDNAFVPHKQGIDLHGFGYYTSRSVIRFNITKNSRMLPFSKGCVWMRVDNFVRKVVDCHSQIFSLVIRLSYITLLYLFIGFELCKCLLQPLTFDRHAYKESIGKNLLSHG